MISTEAILMRTIRLTDTSLIVHWLSESDGLIKTVAKGALRPRSPFSGKLDLFFSGEIVFSRSSKSDLHSLREVSITNWREGLRRSYPVTQMAGYFCQLVDLGVEPSHGDPLVYDLLLRALDYLDTGEANLRALEHFEKQFAEILGVLRLDGGANRSLFEHFGSLPSTRKAIVEQLGGQ
ncbi:MAG: DNA repair protein RecO [Akkermansiaceae bacterium]